MTAGYRQSWKWVRSEMETSSSYLQTKLSIEARKNKGYSVKKLKEKFLELGDPDKGGQGGECEGQYWWIKKNQKST